MNPLSSPDANTTPKPDDASLPQENQQEQQLNGPVRSEDLTEETSSPAEIAPINEQPVTTTSSPFAANSTPETDADSSSEQTHLATGQTSDTAPASSTDETPTIEPTPAPNDEPEPQVSLENASSPDVTSPAPETTSPVETAPEVATDSTLNTTPATSTPDTVAGLPATESTDTGTSTPFNPFDAAASGAVFGAAAAVSSSSGQEPQAAQGGAPQKNKKKLFAIIAGAVLGVALISSAIAFAIIRETPEMILKDMFYATSKKTEGNFDLSLDAESDGKTIKASALGAFKSDAIRSDITVEGSMLPMDKISVHQYATKEKMYLKVDDVRKHIEKLSSMYPSPESAQMIAMLDTLISKIDGKWLVITEDDLEKYFGIKSREDKYSVCVENALKSYQSDKKQQKEVFEAYNKNRFILLTKLADEKISGRNAYHFSVKIDEKKAATFGEEVTKTAVFKNVKKCTPDDKESTFDPPKNETKEEDVPDLQLWVDKQTRTFRKIQVKPTEAQQKKENTKGQLSLTLDFFSKVTMNEPKADVTVGELKEEIDKLMMQAGGVTNGAAGFSSAADAERKRDIDTIAADLETARSSSRGKYPGITAVNDSSTRSKLGMIVGTLELADPANPTAQSLVAGVNPAPTVHTSEIKRYYYAPIGCTGSGLDQKCNDYVLYAFLDTPGTSVYSRSSSAGTTVLGAQTEQHLFMNVANRLFNF